jgi:hypothetical protein
MTNEQILELAKSYKFDEFVREKDDKTDAVEEQLIVFARRVRRGGSFYFPKCS